MRAGERATTRWAVRLCGVERGFVRAALASGLSGREVGQCGGKERKRVGPGVKEWAEAGLRARDGLLGHGALLEFRWV